MNLRELLIAILQAHQRTSGGGLPKTRLLKLGYLVDVEHTRKTGKRLVEEDWVYFLYGPYVPEYDQILASGPFEVEAHEGEHTAELVSLPSGASDVETPAAVGIIVGSVLREFGSLSLEELLDYVYFETEPMMAAVERGQKLDFAEVRPESYYRIRKPHLPRDREEQMRRAFREKVRRVRGTRDQGRT